MNYFNDDEIKKIKDTAWIEGFFIGIMLTLLCYVLLL